jgi:hypothetical protein
MIRLLSALGRATVILAAVLTIAGFTFGGYMGTQEYDTGFVQAGVPAVSRLWGTVAGVLAGIVVAGAVFGPLATLYDTRDNLRRLAGTKD